MNRLALALVPLSLAAAGAAFAQTAPAANPPASPPAVAAQPAPATPHRSAIHRAAARLDQDAPQERRMTKALNLLEAQGFGEFKDFRADGTSYDASVVSGGKPLVVTVNPDSGQITHPG